jgi:hypothetical protein
LRLPRPLQAVLAASGKLRLSLTASVADPLGQRRTVVAKTLARVARPKKTR